ncbi:MAG: acyl carrier protein [Proteobacteria bacterium]|nr:acyl carrier protein [Pseudomonadota bacterium]MBU1611430.1 acyl carrier protein [Pseudomonadota bacterium]
MPDFVVALTEIIKESKQIEQIDVDAPLLAHGILDSFDIITLVARIEEDFGILLDGEAITAEHFKSINTIAALLRSEQG